MNDVNDANRPSGAPPYPEDICPVCNAKATHGCKCMGFNGISNDRGCDNGHKWYWDNGKKVLGSHHNQSIESNISANKVTPATIKISKEEWNALR